MWLMSLMQDMQSLEETGARHHQSVEHPLTAWPTGSAETAREVRPYRLMAGRWAALAHGVRRVAGRAKVVCCVDAQLVHLFRGVPCLNPA